MIFFINIYLYIVDYQRQMKFKRIFDRLIIANIIITSNYEYSKKIKFLL